MLGRLFLLFTLVPLVELWLLVQIGEVVGLPATLGAVLATGALGASLARREGMRTLHMWQNSLSQGQLPDEGIASGLLILVGGIFLITPGVLTDVIGLSLLIPPLRRTVGHALTRRVQGKINVHGSFGDSLRGPPSAHPGDAVYKRRGHHRRGCVHT